MKTVLVFAGLLLSSSVVFAASSQLCLVKMSACHVSLDATPVSVEDSSYDGVTQSHVAYQAGASFAYTYRLVDTSSWKWAPVTHAEDLFRSAGYVSSVEPSTAAAKANAKAQCDQGRAIILESIPLCP